uniref:Uncharacterized protein n=1 Tax=Neobodo designis TaxID=312471 RepID=A0A7S1ML76_NEODS|mmetsp:Transcript_42484/g.131189  ORF Transcript_42484/g.131189 Transcript_42484/m.131189 type:complete len:673 (+) Transcript_42484:110-2128(+)
MGPKKAAYTPFTSRARARSLDPPSQLNEDMAANGEFRDTAVTFAPAIPKADVSLTISFRCTTRLVRGDTVTVRLGGFKSAVATVFCLEPRPHPEGKDFRDCFHAYWSGDSPPKGGPPAGAVFLQVRQTIEQNTLVIVGVPDTVHICLPDKLGANSAKLKIEGVVKHSNGPGPNGKIPKAPVLSCPEVKKHALDEDLTELQNAVTNITDDPQLHLGDDEIQYALETTQQEADHIWEAVRDVSELKVGLGFRIESAAWTEYKDYAPLTEMIIESYKEACKRFHPLALHKEIAKNLDVKVGQIVMLEDALFMLYGSKFSELSRAAILVLRLWTMEPVDLCRVLCTATAPSVQREIVSGLRSFHKPTISKWALCIGTLMTTPGRLSLIAPELIPPLFRAVKDLPSEAIQRILSLKKDSLYAFPNFATYVTETRMNDENFSAPENAVIFEIHGALEGIEIADLSQFPENREWFLPMFASFNVVSVEQHPEKSNLVHVVLRYRGSLTGSPREENFPDKDRSLMSSVAKTAKTNAAQMGLHSHTVAKLVYANIRLNDLKAMHPAHVVNRQYLDKFADVSRASIAKQQIEEGHIRWVMSSDPYVAGGEPVNLRTGVTWDPVGKKQAAIVEALFLKRTRIAKQFTADGVTVDFKEWTVDLGKGVRRLQRLVDKHYTHPYVS